jgi:hypothetical protein
VKPKNDGHDLSLSLHNITAEQSHYIMLALRLLDLGIIRRGEFTLMETRHDPDCPTLVTGSGLDCNCDCEIEIGGCTHSYSDLVKPESCP